MTSGWLDDAGLITLPSGVRAGYHHAAAETRWQRHWLLNASWPG